MRDERAVIYSLTTGVFTRKQKHTFTFVKAKDPTTVETV